MLETAFSPCPNDTFIFHAWATGIVGGNIPIKQFLADVQRLNEWAMQKTFPVTKLSFFALWNLQKDYCMLPSGAALGFNCGPKLISLKPHLLKDLPKLRVAIPGKLTTANFLLDLLLDKPYEKIFCLYNEIDLLIRNGKADCGLIIHESRFTFHANGFHEIVDLGHLWEKKYQCPLPLGCIAVKRDLGERITQEIAEAISQSIQWGLTHPEDSRSYIQEHSIEKNVEVIDQHIRLYVNDETIRISNEGKRAIDILFNLANQK